MTPAASRSSIVLVAQVTGSCALLLIGSATSVAAQEPDSPPASHWMVGTSLGVPGTTQGMSLEFTTVGMSFTQMQPGRLGADISVGTMPRALAFGVLAGAMRGGLALPIETMPGVLVIPSAGVSFVGGVGAGGAGGTPGFNVGGATVFGTGNLGVRTGVTVHWFPELHTPVWLLELGVVHLPGRGA